MSLNPFEFQENRQNTTFWVISWVTSCNDISNYNEHFSDSILSVVSVLKMKKNGSTLYFTVRYLYTQVQRTGSKNISWVSYFNKRVKLNQEIHEGATSRKHIFIFLFTKRRSVSFSEAKIFNFFLTCLRENPYWNVCLRDKKGTREMYLYPIHTHLWKNRFRRW